jgi:GGDEF domain-containing protein
VTSDLGLVLAGVLAALVVTAASFAVTTAMRHNDPANRLWCGSALAALGAGLAVQLPGADLLGIDTPTASAACAALALGLLWSGLRRFGGRTALPLLPLAAAAAVVVVRTGLDAVGSPLRPDGFVVAAAFAAAGVVELRRSPMHLNLNVRLLQVALAAFAATAAVNAVLGRLYDQSPHVSGLLLTLTLQVALPLLSSMRAEREGAWWSEDHGTGRVFGVHSRAQFLEAAADRLERLQLRGGNAGLVLAEITDLVELNEAFGRRGGDLALDTVADALRRHVPAWSVLGYLGVGRFVVLAPADSPERTAEIAAAVERAVYARSSAAEQGQDIPVPVLFGTADTFTCRPEIDALLAAARRA